MGKTVPAQAACGDAVIGMGPDESVLILIKHCRDMKQQETRLRIITLLLLLSCAALFIFAISTNLKWHESSGFIQQRSAAERSPAYSKQQKGCSPAEPQKLHIDLRLLGEHNSHIKWEPVAGGNYSETTHSIVIPENGFYFIYMTFDLGCNETTSKPHENFKKFFVQLKSNPQGYSGTVTLTSAEDGIRCPSEKSRSVFVGKLFELLEHDQMMVLVKEGYKLIKNASFGAFRV